MLPYRVTEWFISMKMIIKTPNIFGRLDLFSLVESLRLVESMQRSTEASYCVGSWWQNKLLVACFIWPNQGNK